MSTYNLKKSEVELTLLLNPFAWTFQYAPNADDTYRSWYIAAGPLTFIVVLRKA
jgi:hypothetical protein